tara:strand:+ start:1275 stop:2396 length:1122 start_codon:yes stop_codon:yes gene_type:complete
MTDREFIPIANPNIDSKEAQAVYDVIKSGWISMGKKVQELEAKICKYIGVKHAILFNSGTSSLHTALIAAGVQENDEVIVPTLSYISSGNTIIYCGAKPVFCDADNKTFNASAADIKSKITEKTKAIMIVDLKGMPADFDEIISLAKKKNIKVIGDSAESFGAIYKNKKVGSQLDAHSFSFFANKNLTMGEGGLVTTNDDEIAKKCKIFRNQGQSKRYEHIMIGNNYRLNDYAAAFGLVQLSKIDWILEEKGLVAESYDKFFEKHDFIKKPYRPEYVSRHSWYMYSITLDEKIDRDKVADYLKENNIDTRLSFPPIHLQPIYKEKFAYKVGDFPKSEKAFNTFLDIPCWAEMGEGRIKRVVDTLNKAIEKSFK